MAIRCKIDDIQQLSVKMYREDVNNFNDKTDRNKLVTKYFSDALSKEQSGIKKDTAKVRDIKIPNSIKGVMLSKDRSSHL